MTVVYKILVGEPEGKRSLRRPRRGCEGNIRMALKKMVRRCGVVNTVMNLRVT